jgi:hypothetical protein
MERPISGCNLKVIEKKKNLLSNDAITISNGI